MGNEKKAILLKYNIHVQNLNSAQNQLMKEKQMRHELEKMYEEHDRYNEKTILRLENVIRELQTKLKKSEQTIKYHSQDQENKTYVNSETQTMNNDLLTPTTSLNSFLLTELAQLKTKFMLIEGKLAIINPKLGNGIK